MLDGMQHWPINLISVLQHAGRWHGEQEVVSRTVEGPVHRQTYADTLRRATRLACGIADSGVAPGDRIGTLAWNTHRHLEAWYAISGQGAVCHTINPRLFPDQIRYIINHAADRMLFVDLTFTELLTELMPQLTSVETVVVMTDRAHMPDIAWPGVETICFEDLVEAGRDSYDWPVLDERSGSSLCYTSGTTGDPKGVLYTHRSNMLHAWCGCSRDGFDLRATDNVLMVVPMFHANSWGLAYAGPMAGSRLVLPGPFLDGASIHELLVSERVTKAAAVPTVWNMLIAHLEKTGAKLDDLAQVFIGGSAVPRAMIELFERDHGVEVIHAWGMTETSPIGTVNWPKPGFEKLSPEERLDLRCKQGRPVFGVDLKIVDDAGRALPHDGESFGRLMCRGPWVVDRYYRGAATALEDGWFDTGDIATIDPAGYLQITDRAKDVVKSGGEWISSVDLENAALAHPAVDLAACIGASHPKWGERPVLLLKLTDGATAPSTEDMRTFLSGSFAKWQLPDDVIAVDDIPLTATGKIDKKPLREAYRDCLLR